MYRNTSYLNEDKEMKEIMDHHIMNEIYAYGDLDFEMRELITVAIMSVKDGKELIKDHIALLIENGTKIEIIKEAIYQVIPYAGILCVNNVLGYVHEACKELGVDLCPVSMKTVTHDTRLEKGLEKQYSVFGKEHIQKGYDQASIDLKHIQMHLSSHCFGDFYTRKGLTMKQRELLTFCIIASIGGCENQLRAHIKANLTAGNSRKILIEAITQSQPYIGYPRTLNAIAIINEITSEEKNIVDKKQMVKDLGREVFPIGEDNIAYEKYFNGKSYLHMLMEKPLGIGNVTFEPGCRNHWHIHHVGGQILLVTGGSGWYQEWGKSAQKLKTGDVVYIAPEIKHWHGATKESWFSHITIEIPAHDAWNEWLEEVNDYDDL